MDCRDVDFSTTKSKERISKALLVIPKKQLMWLLALALHLLGARRKDVAALVDMPEESVKTVIQRLLRDGLSALRDRRRREKPSAPRASPSPPNIAAHQDDEWCVVEFGQNLNPLRMPTAYKVQARTVLLSLVNAGLLPVKQAATALGICAAHCRELARKLKSSDVGESLIDKRQGQKSDYCVGPEQKAELVQQVAARAITGHSTSSDVLAEVVNERTQSDVSARTVRWHIQKLGLTNIKKTLPNLVESLKKNS